MKSNNNGGFSLVEVLLAMVILSAIVIPVCTGILLSVKVNTKANDILKSRFAVSSAVETLMAQGIPWDYQAGKTLGEEFAQLGVPVKIEQCLEEAGRTACFVVTVSDRVDDPLVTITTKIRAVEPLSETEPENGDGTQTPSDQGGSQ